MTTLLYIYLAGWIGTSSYGSYTQCYQDHGGGMSEGECYVFMIGAGAVWPVVSYSAIKGRL